MFKRQVYRHDFGVGAQAKNEPLFLSPYSPHPLKSSKFLNTLFPIERRGGNSAVQLCSNSTASGDAIQLSSQYFPILLYTTSHRVHHHPELPISPPFRSREKCCMSARSESQPDRFRIPSNIELLQRSTATSGVDFVLPATVALEPRYWIYKWTFLDRKTSAL